MRFSEKITAIFIPLIAASVISACATLDGTENVIDPLQVDQSAADAAPKPVDDVAIFADLKQEQQEQTVQTEKSSMPFYSAVGGESLGRVAYALYSNRRMAAKLAKLNPEAAGTLTSGQQVYFEMTGLKPNPIYITKDLLERYPQELAEALDTANGQETITISAGETLQSVSQRLYGTTRYWTEIYLLNRDKLSNFDKVTKGIEVTVVRRNGPAPVVKTEVVRKQIVETLPERPKVVEAPPPVIEKIEPREEKLSPDVVVPAPEQPKVVETSKPQINLPPPRLEEPASNDSFWNSTNIRRVVYVGLILIITFFAFYMTRPSKKQKFDMLDMTASHMDGGQRPKLSREDNDRNVVG